MTEPGLCACTRFPIPCGRPITQEDLLCDRCRGSLCQVPKDGFGSEEADRLRAAYARIRAEYDHLPDPQNAGGTEPRVPYGRIGKETE